MISLLRKSTMNPLSLLSLLAVGTILVLTLPGSEALDWPDKDDRFYVYEACYFKYGFLPVDPRDKVPPPPPPGKPEHNVALEECRQNFYRQKFCRNQWRENNKKSYQQICKSFNPHHLKFFGMVFGTIGLGAVLRTVMKLLKLSIPYTVTLMIIGMAFGGLSNITGFCEVWTPFTKVARTPPDIILNVFLPILIFESSFNMKAHLFFRSILSILTLALPGMLLTTFTTAALCQMFFFSYNWSFMVASLFGSIISATDPVAVVAILKECGTSEQLGILVDGESLLNDGVAILLYEIFSEIIDEEDTQLAGAHADEGQGVKIAIMFARITLGGPIFGWVMAKLSISFLSTIFNDAAVEVSVTLCAAYLTYFVGEAYLGVSGVMALVLLGITMSSERTAISPEVQGLVHHFWEMLGYLANTVLFVILGIVITETAASSFKPEDGYYLIFLYFALNIVRLLMIGLVSPLLSRIGYGLSWQNMVVMSWGGLRGAVGICLALQVFKDKVICHRENIGPKILLQTAGIVLLTLVLNGTTTKGLLQMLKLTELSIGKIQDMANAVRQIRSAQHKALRILRHDRFLADANWTIVEESTDIVNPYLERNIKAREEEEAKRVPSLVADLNTDPKVQCPQCETEMETEPGGEEIREITEDARLRLLKALKVSCWRQFEQGVLTEEAVQILVDALEKIEDKKYAMLHHKDFEMYWQVRGFFAYCRKKLGKYNTEDDDDLPPEPKDSKRLICYKIALSAWFSVFIYVVIIANLVMTCWEASFIADGSSNFTKMEYIMFYCINLGFTLIYLGEFGIKVTGLGFGEYMASKWNLLDVVILVIALVEVILSGTYLKEELSQAKDSGTMGRTESSQEADLLKFVRFIRIIRVLRIFRFFKPLIPLIMKFLNERVNRKLFLGYDLGKGFVTAVDDVQKFLPQIIEQPRVLLKFRITLESLRIEVVREMGLLQKEHPGIALAVKTRHASRAVLNHMKESLMEMKEDGLVDEKEFDCLVEEVEQKMKFLWGSPSYMKPASAELSLANISWMAVTNGSKELFEFVYKQATLLNYASGDYICDVGDDSNGIFIIISGLVRIQFESTFEMSVEREEYGIIPNIELFQDVSYENDMEDYFTTGSVIGELGVLTDQPRGGRVVCETGVSAYHIPQSVMKAAMEAFDDPYDSLESRMWRCVGMKIGASLLPTDANYASWTLEKVKAYLERSAVPTQGRYKSLVIPDFISDVVVIYGQMCNANEPSEVFTAPCLIPKTVTHIMEKQNGSVPARVLIIADEEVDLWDDENSDEEFGGGGGDDEKEGAKAGEGGDVGISSFHHMLHAGTRGNSMTEEDILSMQLQRQSRTVSFGVVPQKSKVSQNTSSRSKSKTPLPGDKKV